MIHVQVERRAARHCGGYSHGRCSSVTLQHIWLWRKQQHTYSVNAHDAGSVLQVSTTIAAIWMQCQIQHMRMHAEELRSRLMRLYSLNACGGFMTQHGNIKAYRSQGLIMELETPCRRKYGCTRTTNWWFVKGCMCCEVGN